MHKYNLGFLSDEQIFSHVKETVEKYRYHINLAEFNKNLIDPIKLTFDSKIYNQTIRQTIEANAYARLTRLIQIISDIFIRIFLNLQEMAGKSQKMEKTADLMLQTMPNISFAKLKTNTIQ